MSATHSSKVIRALAAATALAVAASASIATVAASAAPNSAAPQPSAHKLSGPAAYVTSKATVFGGQARRAARYLESPKYYEIDGAVVNGHWSFAANLPAPRLGSGRHVIDIVEVGVNNLTHSQLVAVGVVVPGAPAEMTNDNVAPAPAGVASPDTCYSNYRQIQENTDWRETIPGGSQDISMTHWILAEGYYYASGQIDCQQANEAVGLGQWSPEFELDAPPSFLYYIDSGPEAVAALTGEGIQPSDQKGKCVDVRVGGMTVEGDGNGVVTDIKPGTWALYCNTSNAPSDWHYTDSTIE